MADSDNEYGQIDVATLLTPKFGAISAWFGAGSVWIRGNPKTCKELTDGSHFWSYGEDVCACGEYVWKRGRGWPKKVDADGR